MIQIVNKLRSEQHRESTRKNYYSIWRTFNQFFLQLDYKPTNWEDRLVLFVGYLIQTKHKAGTIRSYVSVIKAVLMEVNVKINEDKYLLNALIKACRYHNSHIMTRLPIQRGMLNMLIDQLSTMFSTQPYLAVLYKAIIATSYFGMLRVGEVTQSQHVIKAKDVHIGENKYKMMLILYSSKTHWKDMSPQIVKISVIRKTRMKSSSSSSSTHMHCPFQLLRDYVHIWKSYKSETEQFFVFSDHSPVSGLQFRKTLKLCLSLAGFDKENFNCQSFHLGRACDLMKMNVSVETIKKLGRWKSNAVFRYLK